MIKIDKEAEKFQDIVQGDFMDKQRNASLKGIMGLQWISEYCNKAKYTIKADDKALVNVFEIQQLVDGKDRVVLCHLHKDGTMPILRDPASCSNYCLHWSLLFILLAKTLTLKSFARQDVGLALTNFKSYG